MSNQDTTSIALLSCLSVIAQELVKKLAAKIRKVPTSGGWCEVKLPHIGVVSFHRVDLSNPFAQGMNEVWCRLPPKGFSKYEREFRGTAEQVAVELIRLRRAPSKAVGTTAQEIDRHWFSTNPGNGYGFDGLREPEIAAWLGLDTELTYRAMNLLAERGLAKNEGERGWFRTLAKGPEEVEL